MRISDWSSDVCSSDLGNKLLWRDDPFEEIQGQAPLLYCRFHGWRYELDGKLMAPTRKDLLLDFDAGNCRVPAIQCEVWKGFIFINLDTGNTQPLRTFLGELRPEEHRVGKACGSTCRSRW